MKYGLENYAIEHIQNVLRTFPTIEKVIIYGSRAKGNYKEGSDVDLCVYGQNIDLNLLIRLELALDELLLPYSFDLSTHSQIKNEALLSHIARCDQLFFKQ